MDNTTKTIRNYTITIDRDLCIGAATCIALAPKAYELDSEAKAVFLETAGEETDETLMEAAKGCPVMAIIIKDQTGKQIFP
ncbi:MAG: ferredoxin [Microgenomates group bacterium]